MAINFVFNYCVLVTPPVNAPRSANQLVYPTLRKQKMASSSFTDTDSLPPQMANCFGIDIDSLAIAELLPPKPGSAVGAKISSLTLKGKPIKMLLGSMEAPVRIVVEPSVFDKDPTATRLNICFELMNPQYHSFFEPLYTKFINILASRSAECSRNL